MKKIPLSFCLPVPAARGSFLPGHPLLFPAITSHLKEGPSPLRRVRDLLFLAPLPPCALCFLYYNLVQCNKLLVCLVLKTRVTSGSLVITENKPALLLSSGICESLVWSPQDSKSQAIQMLEIIRVAFSLSCFLFKSIKKEWLVFKAWLSFPRLPSPPPCLAAKLRGLTSYKCSFFSARLY
jgi:hypothetical protein